MRSMICLAALSTSIVVGGVGCGGHANYVKVNDVALGRVVVYRNGVAYYERRATVVGDSLKVTVPRDKVDDFLKSLTVIDAKTRETLPVSFPRQDTLQSGAVEMVVQLPKQIGGSDVILTYVTESPAWKPSYRVLVRDSGKVLLQGWAIVDNTSGEDWTDVKVGVGSSSALSFKFDLWSVRSVHRETLANRDRFALAPPTGMSPYSEHGARRGERVLTVMSDKDIPAAPGHPDYDADVAGEIVTATESAPRARYRGGRGGGRAPTSVGGYGRKTVSKKKPKAAQRYDQGQAKMRLLARQIRSQRGNVVIEGYADANEANGNQRALDRANMLRNRLIENGVPPAQVTVRNQGVVAGKRGVRVVLEDSRSADSSKAGANKGKANAADADVSPVGESHFESSHAMTVKADTSVMVSIVKHPTDGEVVYLFDPESARGNKKFAFKAVRFRNPTGSTLETGPVTVYGEKRFIGEGMTDPIPPRSLAVIPFALDRQIVVETLASKADKIDSLVTLQRGILTANVKHERTTAFKMTNRMNKTAKVYVRHTSQKGWTLTKHPKKQERVGSAHLYEIDLAPRETRVVEITEATPLVKTLDLHSTVGLDMVKVYLNNSTPDAEFTESVQALLKLQAGLADINTEITSVRQRLADYRDRMDELHGQLVTLQAVKTKGQLMRHLQTKMKEISERVQKATIQLVNLEEQLMMAKIQFQDSVAEMSLDTSKVAGNTAK